MSSTAREQGIAVVERFALEKLELTGPVELVELNVGRALQSGRFVGAEGRTFFPEIIRPLLDGKADVVYGWRFAGRDAHGVVLFSHMIGNRFLTLLSNMFTSFNLAGKETCYGRFRSEAIEPIIIEESRFGFEPEIAARIERQSCREFGVGISYHGRTYTEGKTTTWRDGIAAGRCILKYGLSRR